MSFCWARASATMRAALSCAALMVWLARTPRATKPTATPMTAATSAAMTTIGSIFSSSPPDGLCAGGVVESVSGDAAPVYAWAREQGGVRRWLFPLGAGATARPEAAMRSASGYPESVLRSTGSGCTAGREVAYRRGMAGLEATVRELVAASGATAVGVVAAPVTRLPDALELDADRVFHAASTMKVPVLIELERRIEAGELAAAETLVVRNAFRSLADGSAYTLDPADDSERELYGREGEQVTLAELAHLAITVSSNLATNLLVDLLGAERITATMADLGAPSLVVRRGVEDDAAWRAGLNNVVTAHGLATLFDGIARGSIVSEAASAGVREVLFAQAFNEGIPAGLPPGARVA